MGSNKSAVQAAVNFGVSEKFTGLRVTRIAAALALGLAAWGSVQAAPPVRSAEGPWAKGRVIVMPMAGLDEGELNKIVKVHGGNAHKLTASGLYLVDLPGNVSEKAVLTQLARNPHLKFAELDHAVQATGVANDPYFGSAWHLARINASTAWDSAQGSGITVAILDSGVDSSHADLSARMVAGWNFYDNNSNTTDVYGHGTGVAGAASASTNNSQGVAAVAGNSNIMPVRIADSAGTGYVSMIAQGVTWAADNGAKVINISYNRLWTFPSVVSAAQYAKSKGALVVIAASNNAMDEGASAQPSMIPVSAVDRNDVITTFSSWGNHVAVAAPGLDIWSTTRGGGYGAWWGTSVASPVTAGVVALMMSANPKLLNTQIESLLYSTATDLGAAGRDKYYGYGRIDANAAVAAAIATSAPSIDTQAPTVSLSNPLGSSTVSGLASVSVSASDNVGISKVELRVNGALLATDTAAPFGFSWDTTKVANGMSNLEARAYDAAGNVASSPMVAVNVANVAVADLIPPTVVFGSPTNGSSVPGGNVTVVINGADNSGVAGLNLELLINGARVATVAGSSSLKYTWNTRKSAAGTYTLTANARDAAGNLTSSSISVKR